MVSGLNQKEDILKVMDKFILVEQSLSGEDIVACPDQTMMVKGIYDIVNEAKKNQIVVLVLESSMTNQSVCSSRNILLVVDQSFAVEIIFNNLEELITRGYQCIIYLASGSKSLTQRSIDCLIDKSTGKKKPFW